MLSPAPGYRLAAIVESRRGRALASRYRGFWRDVMNVVVVLVMMLVTNAG